MKFLDIIRMCLRNLTKHKARTFLTVTGVIIGTCAIIVMISIGIGMNEAQTAMISEWADLTLVEIYNYGGGGPDGTQPADMTDDVLKQFSEIEHVKAVTPFYTQMQSGNTVGVYSDEYMLNWAPIVGVYMDVLEEFGYKLKEGRWANDKDPEGTVLFGQLATSDLYLYEDDEYQWCEYDENYEITKPLLDPLKDSFRIVPISMDEDYRYDYSSLDESSLENQEYGVDLNVVGIVQGDWSDYYTMQGVFVDISFMKQLIDGYNELNPDRPYDEFNGVYNNVRLRVDDMNNVADVEKAIQDMGYQTSSANEMRENMMQQTQTIQLMLGALAAISLFVAALNITNTMIMSIIERTKEIGIMKVLGCNIRDIRTQFLGEAASIGFIGGVLGIGISYLASFLINTFLRETLMGAMGGGQIDPSTSSPISVIPLWLNFAALAFATVVGLASGFYPANKAVKISALAAISHE